MKYLTILLAFFVVAFCFNNFSLADESWELVSGITEADIKEVAVDSYKKGVVYAAGVKTLYRTEDDGSTWRAVFSLKGDSNAINFISASEHGIFVSTDKGVFKSPDGKSDWKRVFKGVGTEENSALHMAFLENQKIYLGTKGGLLLSKDNGQTWEKDSGGAGSLSIKWISFLEGAIFLAAEKGVYKGSDFGWRRVFVTSTEETGYDSDQTDEAASAEKPVNSIIAHDKTLFLATEEGVFTSEDKGDTWKRFIQNGLISLKVKRLLFKDNLFAATDKGIFVFSGHDKTWKALYEGMSTNKTRSIAQGEKGILWVATDKGLYKSRFKHAILLAKTKDPVETEKDNVLKNFDHEPGIKEVQTAAIEYAEVHPDKIKEWREAANKKALLPNVSLGLDRYVTDYYHWDAGQNPDILQKGDDVISWDVTMTWNLGELIWNDDQTSIDTRSRLMVQLRDDILDEVTRTYFERRRLQIERHLLPPSDLEEDLKKELRIQELTADLDALTGGYFSARLR